MITYGARTLPQALDTHTREEPNRLYASVPISNDLSRGFRDVTCKDMSRCVDNIASLIVEKFGKGIHFETIAYIGIPDLRGAAVFLGAVKAGYKVLLPSPRNPPATNLSLMAQTLCVKLLYATEAGPIVKAIETMEPIMRTHDIPSFQGLLDSSVPQFLYEPDYHHVRNDPIVVLHSSGSTGLPKPIIMTHATFAVLDSERNLPTVPGRKNRDYSIWDLNGGGRFYTVFPYFHLAGFLSLLVNPIFTEASSPVLGPPLMPPSGSLLKEVMRHQTLRALYLPPSIAESLLLEPNGLDFFRGLDFLCYTGAPFSPDAGKQLSIVTELCPLYGSTEAFQIPQLAPAAPEDWAWMEWNPCFKVEMQQSEDEPGTFEAVLFADETTEHMLALNHNLPGVSEYRTRDLFKQHPTKSGLWQYYGRRDDIIVLSNGAKFNPIPMELTLPSHEALSGALVVGAHRTQATLLLEVNPDQERSGLIEKLWPVIEKANLLLPTPGRIMKNSILLSTPEKPFIRAGKGTVVRKLTEKLYQAEIDELYASSNGLMHDLPTLNPTLALVFNLKDVTSLVRRILSEAFPDMADVADKDDLFSKGLDSIKTGRLVSLLKRSLISMKITDGFTWLDAKVIFQQSSILGIAAIIHARLNNEDFSAIIPQVSRRAKMQELIEKYTNGLPNPSNISSVVAHEGVVALIGSTGYLGPQIVLSLLSKPEISSVYCLNRGSDAKDKTILSIRSTLAVKDVEKLHFLQADLGRPNFGLDEPSYALMSSSIDHIIFNAWNPNFSLPIQSFEIPFLRGLRTAIDLSASSQKRPHIVFVSSIAAIGSWPEIHDKPTIPEEPAPSNDVAMHMGYGESKCIGEQILAKANKTCDIPVSIVRAGQIGGFSSPEAGLWPRQGWLYNLFKASNQLGYFPKSVSPLDWIPVDTFAAGIADLSQELGASNRIRVYNMVHPSPTSWGIIHSVLTETYSLEAKETSLPDWLDRLANATEEATRAKANLRASKIYDFLRSLKQGREFNMKCSTVEAKSILGEVVPLDESLLAAWLRGWNLNFLVVKENI